MNHPVMKAAIFLSGVGSNLQIQNDVHSSKQQTIVKVIVYHVSMMLEHGKIG